MHDLNTFILKFSAILLCIDTLQLSSVISFIVKNWILNELSQINLASSICTLKIPMFLGSTERKHKKTRRHSVSPLLLFCPVA